MAPNDAPAVYRIGLCRELMSTGIELIVPRERVGVKAGKT
jgi:hypothetical protein